MFDAIVSKASKFVRNAVRPLAPLRAARRGSRGSRSSRCSWFGSRDLSCDRVSCGHSPRHQYPDCFPSTLLCGAEPPRRTRGLVRDPIKDPIDGRLLGEYREVHGRANRRNARAMKFRYELAGQRRREKRGPMSLTLLCFRRERPPRSRNAVRKPVLRAHTYRENQCSSPSFRGSPTSSATPFARSAPPRAARPG